MSYPVTASTIGNLSLDVEIPVGGRGACSCFFARRVEYEGVVYDEIAQRLVAKEPAHMTESEKAKTRKILADFIKDRVGNDNTSYAIICEFIGFDIEGAETVRLRQVQKLKELLEASDRAILKQSSSRKSSDESGETHSVQSNNSVRIRIVPQSPVIVSRQNSNEN